jgi:transcriptional regulator with XRE-family HTH domain
VKLDLYLAQTHTSRQDLAKALGVSNESVRRYCSGERKPDWTVLAKLTQITHGAVSANDFVPTGKRRRVAAE